MSERTSADLRVRQILLEGAREVYAPRDAYEREVDREEDRAAEERATWSSYGETQELPDGDEPPTEGWLA